MKLKYKGPGAYVMVAGFGRHDRKEIKDYPDEVAEELLATSKRQKFQVVGTAPQKQEKDDKPKGAKAK